MEKNNILSGQDAKDFYLKWTDKNWHLKDTEDYVFEPQTSGFSPSEQTALKNTGGYWKECNIWMAFDFTNGTEVFIEEFEKEEEAIKYAFGELALTKQGTHI